MGGHDRKKKSRASLNQQKPWIAGTQPFFTMTRASLTDFDIATITVDVVLPLTSIMDPTAMELTVLRTVLHKPLSACGSSVVVVPPVVVTKLDDSSPSAAVPGAAITTTSASSSKVVVDVVRIAPLSNTIRQTAGTNNFTVKVVTTVRVATVAAAGVVVGYGIGDNRRPFPDTFRVRLTRPVGHNHDDNGSSGSVTTWGEDDASHANAPIVLCRCGEDEPVSSGSTVLIGVEPILIKCLAIRPPRDSAGSWRKEATAAQQMTVVFTPATSAADGDETNNTPLPLRKRRREIDNTTAGELSPTA